MKNILIIIGLLFGMMVAEAKTTITVVKSEQKMYVISDLGSYTWPVSTARKGYNTPTGTYHPIGLQVMHYSKKYDNSPMPFSIFFTGGYAIHGTPHVGGLGKPHSHGCVRLLPANAKILFNMVSTDRKGTTIYIKK